MKKVLSVLAVFLLILTGLAWHGWQRYQAFLSTPLDVPPQGQVFMLDAGATGSAIVQQLSGLGLSRPGWEWRLLMRLEPHVYRTGEYLLEPGSGPRAVLEKLSSGEVIQYRLTVVEGWTFSQLVAALAENKTLVRELMVGPENGWKGLQAGLDLEHPEGWFLPETYQFTRGDSDRDILVRAHDAMKRALADAWESRDTGLPLESPYELLILASIIEKETALDAERGQVAGVFIRWLE